VRKLLKESAVCTGYMQMYMYLYVPGWVRKRYIHVYILWYPVLYYCSVLDRKCTFSDQQQKSLNRDRKGRPIIRNLDRKQTYSDKRLSGKLVLKHPYFHVRNKMSPFQNFEVRMRKLRHENYFGFTRGSSLRGRRPTYILLLFRRTYEIGMGNVAFQTAL